MLLKSAAAITALVLVTALATPALGETDSLPTLLRVDRTEITKAEILRVNPWLETIIAVTPKSIERDYSLKAVVTGKDATGLGAVVDALWGLKLDGKGCYGHSGYTAEGFPASWAVILYDASNSRLGAVYLSNDGLCSVVDGDVYSLDPSLVIFLRRNFSFMNF